MSIDINAVFHVDDGLERLKHFYDIIQQTTPDEINRVCEVYKKSWRNNSWELTDNRLVGIGGFCLTANADYLKVYHMMRYSYFIEQSADGQALLSALYKIAEIINAKQFIICHELLPYCSDNFASIIDSLTDEFGQPSINFQALQKIDLYEQGCWMLFET